MSGIGVSTVRGFRDDSLDRTAVAGEGLAQTGILQWSPEGAGSRFPVADLPGWVTYVQGMVHDHPRVRQWEVWNEPQNFATDPTPADYARIVTTAYDSAKAVDPAVRIGLATKATSIAWLRESIEAGAAQHFDYVTLHPYERAAKVRDGWEQPFLGIVPEVRAMLARVSPSQADVPVQFTEVGSPAGVRAGQAAGATSTPAQQAVLLTKVLTLSVAQGVELVSWYDPFDGDYSAGEAPFGLIALDGRPRPAFAAYRNLISALGVRPTYLGMVRPDSASYVFAFACGDRVVLVGWGPGAPGSTLNFASPVDVRSASAARSARSTRVALTLEPRIITVASSADASRWRERAARELRANEVSRPVATWTAGTGANGLYLSGAVRTATVAGRAGFRPSGSTVQLAIDPRFVGGRGGRVRMTAVVRGLTGSPGFNVKYDASGPLAGLDWAGQRGVGSWTSINGRGWREVSWVLSDAEFSGQYGFNIRFDSDTAKYAGYVISEIRLQSMDSTG